MQSGFNIIMDYENYIELYEAVYLFNKTNG